MAKKTKGELISDIELRLTKSFPSDDLELERDQIALWLDQASNAVVSDLISKQIAKNEDINPYYITISDYISPESETLADVADVDERYFISISSLNILPPRGYSRDYGIIRVKDKYNKDLVDITGDQSGYMGDLWYSKADSDKRRFLWYREGGKVFVDGINSTNSSTEKFRVFYIEVIDSSSLADSATYPISEDIMPVVIDIAMEIGIEQMTGQIINDTINEGIQ